MGLTNHLRAGRKGKKGIASRMAGFSTILIAGMVLAGCSTSPAARYFVLSPVTANGQAGAKAPVTLNTVLGVGPVNLPGELDRSQIVVRTGANELSLRDFDRWGEPLEKNATRILMQDLDSRLSPKRIETFPWTSRDGVDWQISVDVLNFERQANGDVRLNAIWKIVDFDKGKIAVTRQFDRQITPQSGDTAAIVSAMSTLLGSMADDIAASFK